MISIGHARAVNGSARSATDRHEESSMRRPGSLIAAFLVGVTSAGWWLSGSGRGELRARDPAGADGADLRLLETAARTFESVAERVGPAVVFIETKRPAPDGKSVQEDSGSGVMLRLPGVDRPVIVTNAHVLEGVRENQVELRLADSRAFAPTRIHRDAGTDLAVLEIPIDDVQTAALAGDESTRIGQWVLAIGSPFGLTQSVSHGIISAKGRRQLGSSNSPQVREFVQTDAPINPGNSGGPLVSLRGEVIGINTAIASPSGSASGVSFAIPARLVRRAAVDLVKFGRVRRAFLGIEFPARFDAEKADALGLDGLRGACVMAVVAGSPAERGGLKSDDVLLEFNGTLLQDQDHLVSLVAVADLDRPTPIKIWRGRREVRLEMTLTEWTGDRP
jgi:serine protease Do